MELDPEKQHRLSQRAIANSNERRRMESINAGFEKLRALIALDKTKNVAKISKALVLKGSADQLEELMKDKDNLLSYNSYLKQELALCKAEAQSEKKVASEKLESVKQRRKLSAPCLAFDKGVKASILNSKRPWTDDGGSSNANNAKRRKVVVADEVPLEDEPFSGDEGFSGGSISQDSDLSSKYEEAIREVYFLREKLSSTNAELEQERIQRISLEEQFNIIQLQQQQQEIQRLKLTKHLTECIDNANGTNAWIDMKTETVPRVLTLPASTPVEELFRGGNRKSGYETPRSNLDDIKAAILEIEGDAFCSEDLGKRKRSCSCPEDSSRFTAASLPQGNKGRSSPTVAKNKPCRYVALVPFDKGSQSAKAMVSPACTYRCGQTTSFVRASPIFHSWPVRRMMETEAKELSPEAERGKSDPIFKCTENGVTIE